MAEKLDIRADLEFGDGLLEDLGLEAEPQARGVIQDLVYRKIPQLAKQRIGRPPKPVTPAATSAADTSSTSAAAISSTSAAANSSTSDAATSTSAAANSSTTAAGPPEGDPPHYPAWLD